MIEFAQRYIPDLPAQIEHYPGERPLFDLHNIDDEIQRALARQVSLKSGGYLIIDQTCVLAWSLSRYFPSAFNTCRLCSSCSMSM